jgi:hypothetical protein
MPNPPGSGRCPLTRRIPVRASNWTAKGRSSRRYLPASRRGSSASLCTHSRPRPCASGDARRAIPAAMGIPPPQARYQAAGQASRSCSMSFSCRGKPSPAKTRSGAAATTAASVRCTPSFVLSKPNGGDSIPAMRSPGDSRHSASAAFSGTPSAPPRRYTDRPSAAAAALNENTSEAPVTRSGSTCRLARAAQTSGMPSAMTSDAAATSFARPGCRLAARATSTLTGMIDPPSPAAHPARTASITSRSVIASNHSFPT